MAPPAVLSLVAMILGCLQGRYPMGFPVCMRGHARRRRARPVGRACVPVGPFLAAAVRRYGRPQAIAADRWRAGELEDGAREARLGLPEPTWRGQG